MQPWRGDALAALVIAAAVTACTEVPPANPFDPAAPAVLHATGAVAGQVVLEGRPGRADGARLELSGRDLDDTEVGPFEVGPTGPDGRFEVEGLPPGVYTLSGQRPHYDDFGPAELQVGFGSRTVLERVLLTRRSVTVHGHVALLGAEPGLGAPVSVRVVTRWGLCETSPTSRACPEACRQDPLPFGCDRVGSPVCLLDRDCFCASRGGPGAFLPVPEDASGEGPCLADAAAWEQRRRCVGALDECDDTDEDAGCQGAELCALGDHFPAVVSSDGSFEVTDVPAGRHYWLIVSRQGYRTAIEDLADAPPSSVGDVGPIEVALEPAPARVRINCGRDFTNVPVVRAQAFATTAGSDAEGAPRFVRFSESPAFLATPTGSRDDLYVTASCTPPDPDGCPQAYDPDLHPVPEGEDCTDPDWGACTAETCATVLPSELVALDVAAVRLPLARDPTVDLAGLATGADLDEARAQTSEGPRVVYARLRDAYNGESDLGLAQIRFDRTAPTIQEIARTTADRLLPPVAYGERHVFFANAADDEISLQFRPRDNMGVVPLQYAVGLGGVRCSGPHPVADVQRFPIRLAARGGEGCTLTPGLHDATLSVWDGAENLAAQAVSICWDTVAPPGPIDTRVVGATRQGDPAWTRDRTERLEVLLPNVPPTCPLGGVGAQDAVRLEVRDQAELDDRPRVSLDLRLGAEDRRDGPRGATVVRQPGGGVLATIPWDLWPADGLNTVLLRTVDAAGNQSAEHTVRIHLDRQQPWDAAIAPCSDGDACGPWQRVQGRHYWTTRGPAPFDLSVQENGAIDHVDVTVERDVDVNVSAVVNGTGRATVALDRDGEHTVCAHWYDLAGNPAVRECVVVVRDTEGPTLASVEVFDPESRPGFARNGTVVLRVAWEDGAGVAEWDHPVEMNVKVNDQLVSRGALARRTLIPLQPCDGEDGCDEVVTLVLVDSTGHRSEVDGIAPIKLDTHVPEAPSALFSGTCLAQPDDQIDQVACGPPDFKECWSGKPRSVVVRSFNDAECPPHGGVIHQQVRCRRGAPGFEEVCTRDLGMQACDTPVPFGCAGCGWGDEGWVHRIYVSFVDGALNESAWSERVRREGEQCDCPGDIPRHCLLNPD